MNSGYYSKKSDIERIYRAKTSSELIQFRVVVGESDLLIQASRDLKNDIIAKLKMYRLQLKEYLHYNPMFGKTLVPLEVEVDAPEIVRWMAAAARAANVGPMAAVAGAIAGMLGKNAVEVDELIIENGGDIYLRSGKERTIAIFAGPHSVFNQLGLIIPPQPEGLGICTSAGTLGPSLSFGKADAAVVIAKDIALADAVATAVGNNVKQESDLAQAVEFAKDIKGVSGVLVVKNDKLAVWGDIINITTLQ